MLDSGHQVFSRVDGVSTAVREQQRIQAIAELGLLESESIPVFEEATQTAARFLDASICILGIMDQDAQRFRSAVGLSRLGLMNELATTRTLDRADSLCRYVVDSQQAIAINDAETCSELAHHFLVRRYGIRAYLGVPLMTSNLQCLGTLAVMDLEPRYFTRKDVEFLELMARWCMSEFERQQTKKLGQPIVPSTLPAASADRAAANLLTADVLSQLTQELRTPLTSVMGMTSMLMREIYGPLTTKQKEYLDIIHQSGQHLLLLINEILELVDLKDRTELNLDSADIEMLCQQAIEKLIQTAQRREQHIHLSVEPGCRIWRLDKAKVKQMLYHLLSSVIHSSNPGSVVRLHVSQREPGLYLTVWVSHPWLGAGLPRLMPLHTSPAPAMIGPDTRPLRPTVSSAALEHDGRSKITTGPPEFDRAEQLPQASAPEPPLSQENWAILGLHLCQQLAEMHGGHLTVHDSAATDYRYVLHLPRSTETEWG